MDFKNVTYYKKKGSIMAEECPVCKMKVELTKVEDYPDYKRRYYSCGHNIKSVSKGLKLRQLSMPLIYLYKFKL
jgi:hypothetical protein